MSPRLQSALVLVLVFLLGALTGGGLATARSAKRLRHLYDSPPPIALRQRAVLTTLDREVDLDADQERRAEAIVAAFEEERQALRREVDPRVAALRTRMIGELRTILRPDQEARFQRFAQRLESRAARGKDR